MNHRNQESRWPGSSCCCRNNKVKSAVALSKLWIDCRSHKLLFFSVRFCRLSMSWNKIVATFWAILERCRLLPKPLGRLGSNLIPRLILLITTSVKWAWVRGWLGSLQYSYVYLFSNTCTETTILFKKIDYIMPYNNRYFILKIR